MMKYLDQHCALCFEKPVRYVKTKGGFWKVCAKCEAVLSNAGLTVEAGIVRAMAREDSNG